MTLTCEGKAFIYHKNSRGIYRAATRMLQATVWQQQHDMEPTVQNKKGIIDIFVVLSLEFTGNIIGRTLSNSLLKKEDIHDGYGEQQEQEGRTFLLQQLHEKPTEAKIPSYIKPYKQKNNLIKFVPIKESEM